LKASLIRVLRSAYSGELAAAHAYHGHAASVGAPAIREGLRKIEAEEWHHRELVGEILAELGAKPSPIREAIFWTIGRIIGALCHIGGRFIPMYGAGRLELWNIREYEMAAALAQEAELDKYIDCLLTMARVESEHEKFFREQVEGHWLLWLFPLWEPPPAKEPVTAATGTPH